MPNYKLTSYIKQLIVAEVNAICIRRIAYAEDAFPISLDEVQSVVMPADVVASLKWLESRNVTGLPRDQDPLFIAAKEDLQIKRDVVIHTFLPEAVFADAASFYFNASCFDDKAYPEMRDKHRIDPSLLRPTTVVALSEWIEGVVREMRLAEVTRATVAQMLETHLPTSGHLLVRWPLLGTLIPATEPEWKKRLRNPPVRTKQYVWPGSVPFEKHIKIADTVLLGGSMLTDYVGDPTRVRAKVDYWQKLPSDPKF